MSCFVMLSFCAHHPLFPAPNQATIIIHEDVLFHMSLHLQPLKYSISTETHLAHIVLFLWNLFCGSSSSPIAIYPSIAILSLLLEFNQMASQLIFLRVRGTLFLCAAARSLEGKSLLVASAGNLKCEKCDWIYDNLAAAFWPIWRRPIDYWFAP